MNTPQFLKIDKSHVAKNKVQKLCQENLEALDQTLFTNTMHAQVSVISSFNDAILSYSGKAALPVLKQFEIKKGVVRFQIDDVIYLTIYEVKHNLNTKK